MLLTALTVIAKVLEILGIPALVATLWHWAPRVLDPAKLILENIQLKLRLELAESTAAGYKSSAESWKSAVEGLTNSIDALRDEMHELRKQQITAVTYIVDVVEAERRHLPRPPIPAELLELMREMHSDLTKQRA